MADASQRARIPIPKNFDPNKHMAALEKMVADKMGEDWSVESIDVEASKASIVKRVSLTEVAAVEGGERMRVNLPSSVTEGQGKKYAAELADQYPGFYLTEFDPFNRRAILTKLAPETLRARDAIAAAIGAKPWEVQASPTADGGYAIKLPTSYIPSKHLEKIEDVAQTVIGDLGWYVSINANTLTGNIVPADPPTFPPAIPYPIEKKVKEGDADLLIGMKLPAPGEKKGEPFSIDFSDRHAQIGGISGAGKDLHIDTLVPTTEGLKTVGELTTDDVVFAVDGTPTAITGFSEKHRGRDLYKVTLDDGQEIITGPTHQWKASTFISRQAHVAWREEARGARKAEYMGRAARYRELAHAVEPGTASTLEKISVLAGESHPTRIRTVGVPESMANRGFVSYGRPTFEYNVLDFNDATEHPIRLAGKTYSGQIVGLREWATAREIADAVIRDLHGRDATTVEKNTLRTILRARGVRERLGAEAGVEVNVYPVDEVLYFLADRCEQMAYTSDSGREVQPLETLTDTSEMMHTINKQWAVRVPKPLELPRSELVADPYVVGAWLGDGTSRMGYITADTTAREGSESDHEAMRRTIDATGYTTEPVNCDQRIISVKGLRSELAELGLLENKHIPTAYLRASTQQRLALLQGLMDTDGHVATSGGCELALSDERLATDALELIRSLGIKASLRTGRAGYRNDAGKYVECKDRYRIHFTTTQPVFRLPRKLERLPDTVRETQNWLYVRKVEPLGETGVTRCVKIAHPSKVFLVGRGFVPTHNSVTLNNIIAALLSRGHELAIIDLPDKAVDFEWCKPFVRKYGWGCENLDEIVATIAYLYEEGSRRAAVFKKYGAKKVDELPEAERKKMPLVFIILDEVTGLYAMEAVPKLKKDHPMRVEAEEINLKKEMLKNRVKKIAAELRFVGIRLIISTQIASVNTGIDTALRTNLGHRILLGANPTENNRKLIFNDHESVPTVPTNVIADRKASRGVGAAELDGAPPSIFKPFYADTDALVGYLDSLGVPRTEQVRPTPAMIDKYIPRLDESVDDAGESQSVKNRKKMEAEAMTDPETGERMSAFEYANLQKSRSVRKSDADAASGEGEVSA